MIDLHLITEVMINLRIIDIVSALLRFITAGLFVLNNKKTWVISNITILANLYNLLQMGFYLKVTTKIVQVLIQAYAWYFWDKQDQEQETTVSSLSLYESQITLLTVITMAFCIYFVQLSLNLQKNPSDFSLELAMITLNYTGLLLSVQRKVECWSIWSVYNIICAYAYYSHGLPCNAIGSTFMLGLAIQGHIHWNQLLTQSERKSIRNTVFS